MYQMAQAEPSRRWASLEGVVAANIAVIFDEIHEEVARQRTQWGEAFDDSHDANAWVAYIAKHAGKAADAMNVHGDARKHWVRVAALAVSAILADQRRTSCALSSPKQETVEHDG